MGKVITVWGSPGSGKSMFCCILAKALTRDKRKAIIINADMNVPMLPVWLPEQIIQTNTSIGQVLSSVEIDTSLVASHVTVLKNYPFIDDGLCGRRKPAELPRGQIYHGTAAHSCCRQTGRFRHSGLQHQHDQCVHSRRH